DRYSPKKLPPSGAFISFGAVPPGLKIKQAMSGNQPAKIQGIRVLDWKRDHPILKHLSLARVQALEAIKLDVPADSEVLLDSLKGPVIVLHREGRNTHLVCAFDPMQSNWPLMVSFPIFLHNSLQFMALGADMDVPESFQPGATPRIARANIQQADPDLKK